MICIYSQNNTNYEANGDAVLEPISCDLEITINGAWSLTLEHPYDPEGKYKYIVEGAVIRADIRCIRELTGIRQRFRIYDYKKGLHSVTAIAFPIAMESTYDAPIDNLVIQNKTGIQAMADLQAKTNKYTLATDITKIASSSFANTNVNSAIASGSDNCFIKVWGGEILYDNLTFNVKNRIGDTEAGDHQVTYGHNLTDITYTKDDSGLITRIYPISQDGIRLNGSGYIDSPKISDYPVIHSHFIQAPYTLINTDAASPSQTAQQTRTSGAAVNTSANTLALSSYNTALAAGYEPEYIKGIRQEIIQAVQTMALASVISTSLYNYLSGIISNAMSFMSELEQPAWDWMGSWEDGWKYGNENGYAVSRYVKIGKTWSYFNAEGYWEEPRDDSGTWDWYQAQADPGRRYGNFTHYYAHNENVYITMSGTLTKYYFDSDGWYDDSKTEASTWDWHGSGTASDPYWFGESGATSEETNKYAHDCWLFIDGSLYFFDHFGYYTPGNKFADYQWDWVETSDGFWFGNAIDQTYGAVYLKSQWAKINGDWIYFDENGYAVQENASQSAAVEVFKTGMAGLKTVVDAQTTIL
ncbi:MAG: phage tail protein, partial [Clostridiales bacterium]|nr:phage tail protein [Clostridiales bacterium]